jgi:hypothetical protein
MNTVAASYSHEVNKTPDGFSVVYKTAPFPRSVGILFSLVLLLPIGLVCFALGTGWLVFFIVMFGIAMGIHRVGQAWRGKGGTLLINDQFIEVQEKKYSRKDIRKIYVTNFFSGEGQSVSSTAGFVVVGQGFTGATTAAAIGLADTVTQAGRQMGVAVVDEIARVSYKLEFIYGGSRKVVLAKGLDSENAEALFQEIWSILTTGMTLADSQVSM